MSDIKLDAGLWEAGQTDDGKVFLQSDDFDHDVRLYVNGDFASMEDRLQYANILAVWMNRFIMLPTWLEREADDFVSDTLTSLSESGCNERMAKNFRALATHIRGDDYLKSARETVLIADGKYGQQLYRYDTIEERFSALEKVVRERMSMKYYSAEDVEQLNKFIEERNVREMWYFLQSRSRYEYEMVSIEPLR